LAKPEATGLQRLGGADAHARVDVQLDRIAVEKTSRL